MKRNKPVHSYTVALNRNIAKYGKELPIPRLVKDILDTKNTINKPDRYENHQMERKLLHWDITESDADIEEYRDEITDAYDLLKVMCGYNYDQYAEGQHISRIKQECGLD